jgi:hypothetical protein
MEVKLPFDLHLTIRYIYDDLTLFITIITINHHRHKLYSSTQYGRQSNR